MLKYYEEYIEIANKDLLPKSIDRFLSEFISTNTSEEDFNEVYGEMKESLAELIVNKMLEDPTISQRSKDLLAQLPFINKEESTYRLAEYTTLDLPDCNYENAMGMLRILLGENDQQKDEDNENMRSRALQALRILDYVNDNINLTIQDFPEEYEQKQRVISISIINIVLDLLEVTLEWNNNDTKQLVKDMMRYIVVSSTDHTPIKESVLDKRYSYIINWLQEVRVVNEDLQIIDSKMADDYIKKNDPKEKIREQMDHLTNQTELIDHIHNYIRSKGFYYEKEEIINLYLSLRSNPIVILSGISGTGKTKMVQWFAESVGATEENGQFLLISIRPDWNDGSDLLGYVDIKGDFKEGPLTTIIGNAANNPGLPYFVLLDEMNLARVEHYFSDILSVMESRKWEDGKVVSSNLLAEETAGFNLTLPNNLYILGTVNMDETTYPFSKKVLDRANTIEFNRIDLSNLVFLNESN